MRHLEQQSGARSSRTSNVRSGAALRVVTLSALLKNPPLYTHARYPNVYKGKI